MGIKNFLTIDWEEWTDTASMEGWRGCPGSVRILLPATDRILAIVRPYKATFFVVAYHVKEYASLIKRISGEGHEIALHGLRHTPVDRYSPKQFRCDIMTAKKMVEDITGIPIIGFRAPNFSIGDRQTWALDVLLSCGFAYDASMTASVYSRMLKQRSIFLPEIPRSNLQHGLLSYPFGGGAFLRLYPYRWTRSGVKKLNADGRRVMIYVHPWELESAWRQVGSIPPRARFIMGAGMSSMSGKMERLMKDFQFGSIRDILKEEGLFIKGAGHELEKN